ncbi:MAG: glycosyltransferase family 61 protein, partial [Chitinophagaceae bacterium]
NRLEQVDFSIQLAPSSLVAYDKNKILAEDQLLIEGEGGIAYRLTQRHINDTPDVILYSIGEAGMAGNEGFVYDLKSHRFISETMRLFFRWDSRIVNSYLADLRKHEPVRLRGITLSITKPCSDSYFHFIHESLPAYLLLSEQFPKLKFDHLIINGAPSQFKKAWLQLAGIDLRKVVYTGYSSHHQCDQLLFLSDLCYHYSPNYLTTGLLQKLRLKAKSEYRSGDYPKRIIASRKNAAIRRLEWEEELATVADAAIVDFEKLSPADTIQICDQCELFIGPHGAAFSNIVFCRPGTKVIEIAFGVHEVLYGRLASVCELDYLLFDVSQKDELQTYLKSLSYSTVA